MVKTSRDVDSTSKSHIQRALREAKSESGTIKDESGYVIKTLELGTLDDLVKYSDHAYKTASSFRHVNNVVSNKDIPRPKALIKDITPKSSMPTTLRFMRRSGKTKNRLCIVASIEDIGLEPSVVSPFVKKKRQMQTRAERHPHFISRKQKEFWSNTDDIVTRKNVSETLFPSIDEKLSDDKTDPSKNNEILKRIDVTLPSILETDKSEKEPSESSVSISPLQEDEKFQSVLAEILQNSQKSLNPGKSVSLSNILSHVPVNEVKNGTMTTYNNKQAQRAIERYYNQKQELQDHTKLLIIHLPNPRASLESGNVRFRGAPKFLLRTNDKSSFWTAFQDVEEERLHGNS